MNTRTLVIFANSVKHKLHCVAGKCISTGEWIRPVSDNTGAELNHSHILYKNPYGTYPVKPLQKIQMGFTKHVPLVNQPENYLIDSNQWQQKYSIDDNEIINYIDNPADLWGRDNRVSFNAIKNGGIKINQSLYLIKVNKLRFHKNHFNKYRANFEYNGSIYDLAVTDPKILNGTINLASLQQVLCISLGSVYNNYCYKLVACVF